MAHFAKLDENNIVENVIVIDKELVDSGMFGDPSRFVQTSYNVVAGVYVDPITREPVADQAAAIAAQDGRQRKNYPEIGYVYDPVRDAFYPPKPYPSWVLDEATCWWMPPIPFITDGKVYDWDEQNQQWVLNPQQKLPGQP